VFDNLGLHRASVLRENYRLILSGYWMLPKSPSQLDGSNAT